MFPEKGATEKGKKKLGGGSGWEFKKERFKGRGRKVTFKRGEVS